MSRLMTAKAAEVELQQYFRDVLVPVEVADLTPHGWKDRFERQLKTERERVADHLLPRS